MLKNMFDRQKVLQNRLGVKDLPRMMPEMLPITVTSLVAEIGEVLEEIQGWKPWRKTPKPVDQNNLDTEVADILHFVVNLCLYLGYDADDAYRVFVEKNEINHQRQDNNY